jgi:hypothetical protein
MRAHCPSVRTEVRDTHQGSPTTNPMFRRHALAPSAAVAVDNASGLSPAVGSGILSRRSLDNCGTLLHKGRFQVCEHARDRSGFHGGSWVGRVCPRSTET